MQIGAGPRLTPTPACGWDLPVVEVAGPRGPARTRGSAPLIPWMGWPTCVTHQIRYSTARIAGGPDIPPIVITMETVGGGEKKLGTCTLIWKMPETDPGAEPA